MKSVLLLFFAITTTSIKANYNDNICAQITYSEKSYTFVCKDCRTWALCSDGEMIFDVKCRELTKMTSYCDPNKSSCVTYSTCPKQRNWEEEEENESRLKKKEERESKENEQNDTSEDSEEVISKEQNNEIETKKTQTKETQTKKNGTQTEETQAQAEQTQIQETQVEQ